jgi:hypothetical protein
MIRSASSIHDSIRIRDGKGHPARVGPISDNVLLKYQTNPGDLLPPASVNSANAKKTPDSADEKAGRTGNPQDVDCRGQVRQPLKLGARERRRWCRHDQTHVLENLKRLPPVFLGIPNCARSQKRHGQAPEDQAEENEPHRSRQRREGECRWRTLAACERIRDAEAGDQAAGVRQDEKAHIAFGQPLRGCVGSARLGDRLAMLKTCLGSNGSAIARRSRPNRLG